MAKSDISADVLVRDQAVSVWTYSLVDALSYAW
jgi:hypothetical protein